MSQAQGLHRREVDERWWRMPAVILICLLCFYLCMFMRYRPRDIDNPWFLSFSYDTHVEHVISDQFMDVRFPGGMDGTQLFGRLAAWTQYAVASWAGWRQWPMEALSAACVVAALGLWVAQLRRLGYSREFAAVFLVVAGMSEPFLSTAEKFRYEYLSLLLISLGLLLTANRRVLLGMFVAACAVEVEPMALLGLIPVAVLALEQREERMVAVLGRAAGGAAAAGVLYFALHPNIVHVRSYLAAIPASGVPRNGGIVRDYFLQRFRHLPELAVFLAAAILYWRRRSSIRSHYLGISALAGSVACLLVPHSNVAYMVFVYPFLIGMTLEALRAERRPAVAGALALLCFVPQYIGLAYINRDLGYRPEDIQRVTAAIDAAASQMKRADDKLRIYGDYGLWFAHPHFYRAAAVSTLPEAAQADLYLCYERPPQRAELTPQLLVYCPELRGRFALKLLSQVQIRDNTLYLYAKR